MLLHERKQKLEAAETNGRRGGRGFVHFSHAGRQLAFGMRRWGARLNGGFEPPVQRSKRHRRKCEIKLQLLHVQKRFTVAADTGSQMEFIAFPWRAVVACSLKLLPLPITAIVAFNAWQFNFACECVAFTKTALFCFVFSTLLIKCI